MLALRNEGIGDDREARVDESKRGSKATIRSLGEEQEWQLLDAERM